MLTRPQADPSAELREELDGLDDAVMRYGRAIEMTTAARAAGYAVPSTRTEGAEIAHRAGRVADRAVTAAESREHDQARALRKVAGHLHAVDTELEDGRISHEALEVVARALAAALDVFDRPDIGGLARLQERVDLLLDHVERHAGLRRMAVHLLGIGTAAEFAWANHPHLRQPELTG